MPADRVGSYSAQWDEKNGRVTGLEAWGEQVLEDLWHDLEEETQAFIQAPAPSPQEQERWVLAEFVEMRSRGFVGREEIIEKLLILADSPIDQVGPWGLCVVGEPGSGKSALFAHIYRQLKERDVLLLAYASESVQTYWQHWRTHLPLRVTWGVGTLSIEENGPAIGMTHGNLPERPISYG